MMHSTQSKHILVAEDDSFSQMAVKMILTSLKLQFTIVPDGEAAVKAFQNNKGTYSLILMDLHMPKLDGFGAAKKIRETEKALGLNPIKIVALSADSDDYTKKQCFSSGMQGLVTKPLKKDVVNTLL